MSFSAFMVYGARFRQGGRQSICDILTAARLPRPQLDVLSHRIDTATFFIDNIETKMNSKALTLDTFPSLNVSSTQKSRMHLQKIVSIHNKILQECCLCHEFIREHGLYLLDESWIYEWMRRMEKATEEEFEYIGLELYMYTFRHVTAQEKVKKCFENLFNIQVDSQKLNVTTKQYMKPFVVTKRVLSLWKQIAWNLQATYPILISGPEGCGKSEAIHAFSKLVGMDLISICLTPETETFHLVGQYKPSDGRDSAEKISWQDGCITRAFKTGQWLLLDNLNQTDPCVLERLNPLLENEPAWILTENGEIESLSKKDSFKIFATMTVSPHKNATMYPELSPALYNRFSSVFMENLSLADEKAFKDEISTVATSLLDTTKENISLITDICWEIYTKANQSGMCREYGTITPRNLVRFIDFSFLLSKTQAQLKTSDFKSVVWKAYNICFESQFKLTDNDKSELYKSIHTRLDIKQSIKLLDSYKLDNEYVLTNTRADLVETILACIECNIPILLEGNIKKKYIYKI